MYDHFQLITQRPLPTPMLLTDASIVPVHLPILRSQMLDLLCGDVEVSEKPHSGDISHDSERGRTYATLETKLSRTNS